MTITRKRARTKSLDGPPDFSAVDHAMARFGYREEGLIDVLITAQETFGYLSRDLLNYIAKKLRVPLSRVYGVVTFYDMLTLEPAGDLDVTVCTGPSCFITGAAEVLDEINRFTAASGPDQITCRVSEVSCLGLCDQAPASLVGNKAQVHLTVRDIPALLAGKASLSRLQITGSVRELTGPIGRLPPTDLVAHRSAGAFAALEKALFEMSPDQVVQEVKEARLTGRGGAGFSTGLKWDLTRRASGQPKYIVCNFDESEPGTFKDRVLMEGNPFTVIEGMAISGYVAGAEEGYIFIRGEYPQATEIVSAALDTLYQNHYLGDDILGSGINFDVEIRHNAGAYICGEETALFAAIEGQRGFPRKKPPYPPQSGLFGKPTSINNVETLAVIPSLVLHGGEWFHQWGTHASTGLKLFCLSGNIRKPGVVEAPFGLTIREMIEDHGGGFDGQPQAVLVGGAAGGFLHPDMLDTKLTHEDLGSFDVPIGSGAIMVFNEGVDLWQVLEGLAGFFVKECCGQCAPCRIGTGQIYQILKQFNQGNFSEAELERAEKLARTITTTCFCGLGKTAANPLKTFLKNLYALEPDTVAV